MIEIILSVVVILAFVGVLVGILITPVRNNISKLFAAACTNSCEDTDVVIKRAINGKIIKLDFLGQGNNE
jgi:hypothetical protein